MYVTTKTNTTITFAYTITATKLLRLLLQLQQQLVRLGVLRSKGVKRESKVYSHNICGAA